LPFCTKCGISVPADVKFCTSCGTPITQTGAPQVEVSKQQVKVSHTKRNIIMVVAVLLLLLALAGAAYKPSPETGSQTVPVVQTTTPGQQYDVVIRYTESYSRNISYIDASQGNTFLIVTLEIHNNVDRSFDTDPSYLYVIASSVKYTHDFSATDYLPDTLRSVEVLKGGTVTGAIAFDVPILTTSYQLSYEAPFTSFDINWVHNVAATTQQSQEQLIMESYNWDTTAGTITITIRNVGAVSIDASHTDVFLNGIPVDGGLGTGCVTTLTADQACVATFNVPSETYVANTAYPLKLVTPDGGVFTYTVIAGESS
jgi:archaellum component FlaF (FlaF/FlaG flagellin family)